MLIKKARLSARIRNKKVALIGAHTAGRLPRFFYIRKGKGAAERLRLSLFKSKQRAIGFCREKRDICKKTEIRQKWKQKVTKGAPQVRKVSPKVDKMPTLPKRGAGKSWQNVNFARGGHGQKFT